MKLSDIFLWILLLGLAGSGCETCGYCSGVVTIYLNGDPVETEEVPSIRYCDELLEELQQNPIDTVSQVLTNQQVWTRVTVTACN